MADNSNCHTLLWRDSPCSFNALLDLGVNCSDHLLTVAHRVEFGHKLHQRLDGLPANALSILPCQSVAEIVFESNKRLQTDIKVLDLHCSGLLDNLWLLAGQLD